MRTFKVTVSQWSTKVHVRATCETDSEEAAKAAAALWPKTTLVRGTRCYGGGRTYGLINFQADVDGKAGVRRYRQFRKTATLLGFEVEFSAQFKNSLTEEQLEKFLAGELTFEQPEPERVVATEPETITVTLDLFGEQREVTVEGYVSHHDHPGTIWRASVYGLVGTIGRGAARYPTTLLLNRLYDGDSAFRRGTVVTDQLGRKWTYHLGTVIRNRQATIVGWTDRAGATNYQDQERTS